MFDQNRDALLEYQNKIKECYGKSLSIKGEFNW